MMKKLFRNLLWTISVMVIGITIIALYMGKWIPFEEFNGSLQLVINALWAYGGLFLGFIILAIGLTSNLFFKAGANLLFKGK